MEPLQIQSAQSLFLKLKYQGQHLASGTGFLVDTPKGTVLITNRHNVTGRDQMTNIPLDRKTGGVPDTVTIVHHQRMAVRSDLGKWVERTEPLYSDDDPPLPLWREHPVFGARADFVALPLTKLDDVQCYPYDLKTAFHQMVIGPADTVSVIGFLQGMAANGFPIWATGFVASEPRIDYNNLPILLIDCRTRKGQSGSPVIAFRQGSYHSGPMTLAFSERPVHKFIGIYSGRIHPDSDVGMVWKVSAIQELVDTFSPTIFDPRKPVWASTQSRCVGGRIRGYRVPGA